MFNTIFSIRTNEIFTFVPMVSWGGGRGGSPYFQKIRLFQVGIDTNLRGVGPLFLENLGFLCWYRYQFRGVGPPFFRELEFSSWYRYQICGWGVSSALKSQKSGFWAMGWYPGP